jgi:hypothetical protein
VSLKLNWLIYGVVKMLGPGPALPRLYDLSKGLVVALF